MFGYSPDEYIKMGKPGPGDLVEEPLAKEGEKRSSLEIFGIHIEVTTEIYWSMREKIKKFVDTYF